MLLRGGHAPLGVPLVHTCKVRELGCEGRAELHVLQRLGWLCASWGTGVPALPENLFPSLCSQSGRQCNPCLGRIVLAAEGLGRSAAAPAGESQGQLPGGTVQSRLLPRLGWWTGLEGVHRCLFMAVLLQEGWLRLREAARTCSSAQCPLQTRAGPCAEGAFRG